MDWISVKEKYPSIQDEEILAWDGEKVWLLYWNYAGRGRQTGFYHDDLGGPYETITHWMPLPEPPAKNGPR